jgi:hypothetical protein
MVGNMKTWMRLELQKLPHIEELEKTGPTIVAVNKVRSVFG